MGSREKDNKANQRITLNVCLELACLIMPSGHLSLQVLDLLPALTDLRGESGDHHFCCNLQVLFFLELTLQEADPLLGVGTLLMSQVTLHAEPLYGLEQVVLLLL